MRATIALLLFASAAPAIAQVQAREITKEEANAVVDPSTVDDHVMKSPMLLEVPLKTSSGADVFQFLGTVSQIWRTNETASYVVDRARVKGIQIERIKAKKGHRRYSAEVALSTQWFRQDIDLTLAVMAGDRVLAKRTWDNLTIGDDAGSALIFGSSSKDRALEIDLTDAEWATIANGPMPVLRVIVDVQGSDED